MATQSNHILDLGNMSAMTNALSLNSRDQLITSSQNVWVNGTSYTLGQTYFYDDGGRANKTEVSWDGLTKTAEETTAFDALDNPLTQKVGGNLQTVDYSYYANGFLQKINGGATTGSIGLTSNDVPNENSANDLFAMELSYATNGNISSWKQQNRGFALQNYAYTYDYD